MSHTAIMLLAGIALLIILHLNLRDTARATRLFVRIWLAVSIGNLLIGVIYAGYGWGEEVVVWLLVFGVPAAIAVASGWFGRQDTP